MDIGPTGVAVGARIGISACTIVAVRRIAVAVVGVRWIRSIRSVGGWVAVVAVRTAIVTRGVAFAVAFGATVATLMV